MTYNLYNQQNTTRSKIAANSLAAKVSIADQKAQAKVIDQGIARTRANIARMVANHTWTKQQGDLAFKKTDALKTVFNHQYDNTTSGAGTYTFIVREQVKNTAPPTYLQQKRVNGVLVPDPVPPVYKNRTIKGVTQDQYNAWQAAKAANPGQSSLVQIGAQPNSTLVAPPTSKPGGTTATKAWKWPQVALYLKGAKFSDGEIALVKKAFGSKSPKVVAAIIQQIQALPSWVLTPGAGAPTTPSGYDTTGAPYTPAP